MAFSLPTNDKSRNRQHVFDEMPLGKDDLTDIIDKHDDFDDFKRGKDQPIDTYISMFDQKYKRLVKKNIKLPAEILAFRLLKRADLSKQDRKLVLTGLDFANRENLYEEAKKSLKKFLGEIGGGKSSTVTNDSVAIKHILLTMRRR